MFLIKLRIKMLLDYYLKPIGSGEYEEADSETYPIEGYVFNSTLSKCENGGKLTWYDATKKVVFIGTTSDKCYIYFDKE